MENIEVDASNIKWIGIILLIIVLGSYVFFELRKLKTDVIQLHETVDALGEGVSMRLRELSARTLSVSKPSQAQASTRPPQDVVLEDVVLEDVVLEDVVQEERATDALEEETHEPVPTKWLDDQVVSDVPVTDVPEPDVPVPDQDVPVPDQDVPVPVPDQDVPVPVPVTDVPVLQEGDSHIFSEIDKLMQGSAITSLAEDSHSFEDITFDADMSADMSADDSIKDSEKDEYDDMSVTQLRIALEKNNLPVSGNKAKMRQRLRDHVKESLG